METNITAISDLSLHLVYDVCHDIKLGFTLADCRLVAYVAVGALLVLSGCRYGRKRKANSNFQFGYHRIVTRDARAPCTASKLECGDGVCSKADDMLAGLTAAVSSLHLHVSGISKKQGQPPSQPPPPSSWLNCLKELNLVNDTSPYPVTLPNLTTSRHIQFPSPHFRYSSSLPRPLATPTSGCHGEEAMEWEDEAGRTISSPVNRSINYNVFINEALNCHRQTRKTRCYKNLGHHTKSRNRSQIAALCVIALALFVCFIVSCISAHYFIII